MTAESPPRPRRVPRLRRRRRAAEQGSPPNEQPVEVEAAADAPAAPMLDLDPADPALAWFAAHPEPIALADVKLDTPAIQTLREAGIALVVPLVAQGELIGLLNLGPRLSEQEYSGDDRRLLESLAGQAAPALRVAQLVREQEAEVLRRERYEQELAVAQLIQQHFLPRSLPTTSGWEIDALYRPAREVGGDFYDVVELDDGRLAVLVGDVTDKGVPAALVMASARSVLRSSATRLVEPGAVLARVNDLLCEDMPPRMFVTCLYGVLDPATGVLRFANAGHNLPTVQTGDGAYEPRATGMPLGLMPGMTYDEAEVVIEVGQTALLYSDAIPEAHGPDGTMYGFPQLLGIAGSGPRTGRLIERVLDDLHRFAGPDWVQEDDITLLTLRRTAPAETGRVLAEFTVPSAPGNELLVMRQVCDAVADLDLRPDVLDRLRTAVAEAAMNAIEHGNDGDASLLVEVRVWVDERALVVRVTDQARRGAMPPPHITAPDIDAKLRGEQSPRGWGLYLIRNMVDDVTVRTDDDHNVLELLVRLDGEAP